MDWQTIAAIGVGALVMIGSGIGNWMKQRAEREKAQGTADRRQHAAGSTSAGDLDDVAERRREQLREMARRQQAGGDRAGITSGASVDKGDAMNLTMAERIARARAKAQGERPQPQPPTRPEPSRSSGAPPTRPEVQSQAALNRQREQAELQARRRAQLARRQEEESAQTHARQEKQHRAREAAERQRTPQQHQAAQRQRAVQLQAAQRQKQPDRMRVVESHDRIDTGESVVHRHVPDADAATLATGIVLEPVSLSKMSRASWRRAIILKEVLDLPVALRDTPAYR